MHAAEAIRITKHKGIANVGRMLTFILNHHLLEPNQVLHQVQEKETISCPAGALPHKLRAADFIVQQEQEAKEHAYLPLLPFLIIKGEALRFL